jgi:hypothetical protein
MLKKSKIPPLGVKPYFILREQRIIELKEAIQRFLDGNWPIPQEFIDEYNELTDQLEQENDK